MIGLGFLVVGFLWVAVSFFLALKLPVWMGSKSSDRRWGIGMALLLLLLVGPFVDHIVGMWQFERLCARARISIQVSPDIGNVKRAKTNATTYIDLSGYFVNIQKVQREYLDLDTGRSFLSYQTYFTKGGRVAGITQFEGRYSCDIDGSPEFIDIWKRHNIQNLMDEGRKQ